VVTALGNPLVSRLVGGRIQPGECYRFWDRYAYGFSTPCRDLVREDVTPRMKKQVRAAMESLLTPARHRMLIKIAGWSRIGFLREIFEDARFIHIVRDGRATCSSLMHVDFWRGWRGPQGWGAGMLSCEDQAIWDRHDRSFVALAGLQWKLRVRAIEAARAAIDPASYLEVKYETFCDRPVDGCRQVLEFADLPWSTGFEKHIEAAAIKSTSNRWRDDLTPEQRAILTEVLREDLERYGYDVA
jgi:omega-hydroxy-beta-dihydromenaquinone-9 sulfotransferase